MYILHVCLSSRFHKPYLRTPTGLSTVNIVIGTAVTVSRKIVHFVQPMILIFKRSLN